jgi:Tfp pilus assembly protein PilF
LEDGALYENLRQIDIDIKNDPENSKLHNNKGVILLQLKKPNLAYACFDKALKYYQITKI